MKSLHIALTALGAVFLSLGAPQGAHAQFRTPVIDGASSLAEYGNQYASPNNNDPNLLWRVTWDDTNLYVAIEDANLQEGTAIYIDLDPQLPVNTLGGNVQKGFNNYLNTNGNLPIQADLVIYAEKFYREYRFFNKETNTWGPKQEWALTGSEAFGQYADNGGADGERWSSQNPDRNFPGTVKEFALPWARIGALTATGERKRPENFNWFGQIHYAYDPISQDDPDTEEQEPNIPNPNAGGIYGQVPIENERGDRANGALYRDFNWSYYFTVLNTSTGSDNSAFGPRLGPDNSFLSSYSHTGGSIPNFGSIRAYDFTLNTSGVTITRTDAVVTPPNTVEWNILGNLVVGAGSTLNFNPSTAPLNLSGDLIIDPSGSFTFQNATAGRFRAGGDIIFTNSTSFQTNAEVILTGTTNQTITGGTYRALVVEGSGIKTLTSNTTITSSLAVNAGTLATVANTVTLGNGATFSENGGYLLGRISASTPTSGSPLAAQGGTYAFGGIGLSLTIRGNDPLLSANVLRITGGRGLLAAGTPGNALQTISRRFLVNAIPASGNTNTNRPLDVALAFNYRIENPNELNGNNEASLSLYSTNSTDPTVGPYTLVNTIGNNPPPSRNLTTHTLTFQGPLRLDNTYFSLADGTAPLPVELISFTGKAENNAVRLTWATASEKQNKGFEIERRTDQSEWQTLGFVAGNGTTNQRNNYTYVDRLAVAGNNYYRLRQIDVDGKSVYTQPVTVQLRRAGPVAFSVSPVPTTDVLTLNGLGAGKHVAEIYNARGQRVLSQEFKDSTPTTLSVRTLPVGVYMVRVLGPNRSTHTARFIKQ
ncbi:T9SS type A sorting domain-containing protein [Hymenobacter sp. HDW8]|uniref:T9SS type A sorting domain-containing protein n=1 Tax=Hymenobacter sp. HDW8 TaxID=2714932 RepID=UPI00140B325C|nr:T9SS type A sorting domain-containing protein [Hymenobacter sp. HDW8]QIL77367.1 T9SS type A sorting domain-containing protein [Hymenobacter sp. HDW8]